MSVILVNYLQHTTTNGTIDDRARATYKQKFLVETDSNMAGFGVVNAAQVMPVGISVPNLWDKYVYPLGAVATEADGWAFCRDISFQKEADLASGGQKWIVTTTHRPLDDGEKEEDKQVNPVLRPVKIRWDKEVYREEITLARIHQQTYGNTTVSTPVQGYTTTEEEGSTAPYEIRNTAGGLYEQPIEIPQSRSVMVLTKNYETLSEVVGKLKKYQGRINQFGWHLGDGGPMVEAQHALCRDVQSSDLKREGDYTFYTMVFRIALNTTPWVHTVVERGKSYLTHEEFGIEGMKLEFSENGEFVNLDKGGGRQRRYKKPGESDQMPDPVVTEWLVYPESDFSGIPTT